MCVLALQSLGRLKITPTGLAWRRDGGGKTVDVPQSGARACRREQRQLAMCSAACTTQPAFSCVPVVQSVLIVCTHIAILYARPVLIVVYGRVFTASTRGGRHPRALLEQDAAGLPAQRAAEGGAARAADRLPGKGGQRSGEACSRPASLARSPVCAVRHGRASCHGSRECMCCFALGSQPAACPACRHDPRAPVRHTRSSRWWEPQQRSAIPLLPCARPPARLAPP